MKRLLMFFSVLFLFGCSSEYQYLDQDEAYKQLQEDEDIVLIDVRELSEFTEGHIEGAILVPLGQIETLIEGVVKDKSTKIFVYCRSGNRSKTAAKKLVELGYTNVYDIGGIITWEYTIVK